MIGRGEKQGGEVNKSCWKRRLRKGSIDRDVMKMVTFLGVLTMCDWIHTDFFTPRSTSRHFSRN